MSENFFRFQRKYLWWISMWSKTWGWAPILVFQNAFCHGHFLEIALKSLREETFECLLFRTLRSSPPMVFLGKGVLKICSKFTGEHPCRSVISINLLCNFIGITLRHGCSPVNLLYIFRTPFHKSNFGGLLLNPVKHLKWRFLRKELTAKSR